MVVFPPNACKLDYAQCNVSVTQQQQQMIILIFLSEMQ